MSVDYSLPKPTAGTSRATSPTESEIMADISDTIADVGTRLDAVESGASVLHLSAEAFVSSSGSPTLSGMAVGGRYPGWLMDGAAIEQVSAALLPGQIPSDWTTFHLNVYWANAGAGSGDVTFRISGGFNDVGATLASDDWASFDTTATAGSQDVLVETRILTGQAVDISGALNLRLQRRGSAVGDTLNNDIAIIGAALVKAS